MRSCLKFIIRIIKRRKSYQSYAYGAENVKAEERPSMITWRKRRISFKDIKKLMRKKGRAHV